MDGDNNARFVTFSLGGMLFEHVAKDGKGTDVTRLISARFATNFERGIYYGKYE